MDKARGTRKGGFKEALISRCLLKKAETSRQMLVNDSFDICFSSPLNRSKRTAEIIWNTRKEDILTDLDLREIDLYSFQGLLKHEGKERFGEAYHEWQKNPANFSIDGNYPVRQLWERARNCWDKILCHGSRSVLVVAHNAVNQALIATAMGLGTEYFRALLQSNCGVSVLDFTPRVDGLPPYVCLNRLNQSSTNLEYTKRQFNRPRGRLLLVEVLEAGKPVNRSYLSVMHPRRVISRQSRRLSAAELSDCGCFVALVCGVILLQQTDISLIYHMIRSQGTIKLYVVYNVLEVRI